MQRFKSYRIHPQWGGDIKNNAFQIIPQNIQPYTKHKNVILTGVRQEISKKCVEKCDTLGNLHLILHSTLIIFIKS